MSFGEQLELMNLMQAIANLKFRRFCNKPIDVAFHHGSEGSLAEDT